MKVRLAFVLFGAVVGVASCSSSGNSPQVDAGPTPTDAAAADAQDAHPALDSGAGAMVWYRGCGDPVCGARDAGGGTCTTQIVGAACDSLGATCNTGDACNTLLVCATSDPTAGPFGCPRSTRSTKTQIERLTERQQREIEQEILRLPMSTYLYRDDRDQGRRLGFVLDDTQSPFPVAPGGKHVDVYGFASMAVVTIQAQARRIDELEKRLERLEKAQRAGGKGASPR